MNRREELIKSPLNYIGGKFNIIYQITNLFPNDINTFVDLFGGGLNVGININANKVIYNEKIPLLVELMKYFYEFDFEHIRAQLLNIINEYNLSKTDNSGFLELRAQFNKTIDKDVLKFYALIMYSFNYQIRFNHSGQFNTPHGTNRSSFNKNVENRLKCFIERLHKTNFDFTNFDFKDFQFEDTHFVYCDPPYLVTTGSYNDGNRGFVNWTFEDEKYLLNLLDNLNDRGIKFALSNVINANGKTNVHLLEWSKKYIVHNIDNDFNNSNYQRNLKNDIKEVLITNY